MPRAREAAQQALRLDDTLPQAHSSLGQVLVWYDWDFAAGEREFRRAIALNPSDADAHREFGDYLTARGQFDLAFAEKKKAESLDPLSLQASWDVGRALYYAGRYDEAEKQAKKTLELDDRFPYTWFLLSEIALHRGRTSEALSLCDKALGLGSSSPVILGFWGYINAVAGNRAQAEKVIGDLKSRSDKYVLPLLLARIYGGLGERDEALRQLDRLYEDRSESVVWLKVDSTMEPLRNDPRFLALIKRVGI
jgi:serine/threonine-protein kinase